MTKKQAIKSAIKFIETRICDDSQNDGASYYLQVCQKLKEMVKEK